MSVRAEKRFVRLLEREAAQREQLHHQQAVLDRFNHLPADADAPTPFLDGIIRFDPPGADKHYWYLLNKRETGWASHALLYTSLDKLMRRWRIVLLGLGRDEHSEFWEYRRATDDERR